MGSISEPPLVTKYTEAACILFYVWRMNSGFLSASSSDIGQVVERFPKLFSFSLMEVEEQVEFLLRRVGISEAKLGGVQHSHVCHSLSCHRHVRHSLSSHVLVMSLSCHCHHVFVMFATLVII
jgi:hypothetical protein